MRSRSVVPPMASEVSSASEAPARSSTPRSGSAFSSAVSLIRIVKGDLGSQKNSQLAQGAAHIARANGQDSVARAGFLEQVFDALLHGAVEDDAFVPGGANGLGQGLAGNAGHRRFAGSVDVGNDQRVGLVEGRAEVVPQM